MAYSRQPAAVAAAQCGAICAAASDDLSAALRLSSATSRGRAGRTRTHWEPGAKVRGRRCSGALPGLQHVAMRAGPGPAPGTRRAARDGAGSAADVVWGMRGPGGMAEQGVEDM